MTTTFDHQQFYEELTEVVKTIFAKKLDLYTALSDKAENLQRKDAIVDILSIFSLKENVTEIDEDMESPSIEKNIQLIVKEYYSFAGNETLVGTTADDVLLKELDDIAIMVLAKFPYEHFVKFNSNLPLSHFEKKCVDAADQINQVETSILTVIKSEILLLNFIGNKKSKNNTGTTVVT